MYYKIVAPSGTRYFNAYGEMVESEKVRRAKKKITPLPIETYLIRDGRKLALYDNKKSYAMVKYEFEPQFRMKTVALDKNNKSTYRDERGRFVSKAVVAGHEGYYVTMREKKRHAHSRSNLTIIAGGTFNYERSIAIIDDYIFGQSIPHKATAAASKKKKIYIKYKGVDYEIPREEIITFLNFWDRFYLDVLEKILPFTETPQMSIAFFENEQAMGFDFDRINFLGDELDKEMDSDFVAIIKTLRAALTRHFKHYFTW